jgi:hypothetical protein
MHSWSRVYNSGSVDGGVPTWITHLGRVDDDFGYTISTKADKTYVTALLSSIRPRRDDGHATQRIAACAMRQRGNGVHPDTSPSHRRGQSSQTILPTSTLPAVTDQVVIGWLARAA